jgi:DNA invertase Pin-like site-specific DNA recombinase
LRVAAYARVSSGKDAMLHSLSAQISHYSECIQKHPGWLYADGASTGTKEDRPQLQKLMKECRAAGLTLS